MYLLRPSLDSRHVTPPAANSESPATHALKKRLTADELAHGFALDLGKALPISYLLALAQSWIAYPKPAGSEPAAAQPQFPQQGEPNPQNPTGGYYPGAPILQDPRTQPQGTPQSYYDPRTNQQAYYQDPRLQDPRFVAALQQQAQQIATAGDQEASQDNQPAQGFGRIQADLSQLTPAE